MLNTYTVQVTDHQNPPTKEEGFFACVTHYPDAPDLGAEAGEMTRTSAWAPSEDEAVAKALRDNAKVRATSGSSPPSRPKQ